MTVEQLSHVELVRPAPLTGPVAIYGLVDPYDGTVRYIGRARKPNMRMSGHRSAVLASVITTRWYANRRVAEWWLDLWPVEPEMVILARTTVPYEAFVEDCYIRHVLDRGAELLNGIRRPIYYPGRNAT